MKRNSRLWLLIVLTLLVAAACRVSLPDSLSQNDKSPQATSVLPSLPGDSAVDGPVLLRGSLRMATGLIAKVKPEQVKVTTPTTVIGVRGTDFIVEENP